MTQLPVAGYFSNASRTEGEQKQWGEDVRDVIEQLLGGGAEELLTIATGVVTPTGALLRIDTEASAASDDLDTIQTTNHPAGRVLVVRAANDTRNVVVKDQSGGAGEIHTVDGNDFSLDQDNKYIILRSDGTDWIEVGRFFGDDMAAARAFYGLTNAATLPDPTASADAGKYLMADGSASWVLAGPMRQRKNALINGDFDVWQRGTSFAATGYCADRWRHYTGAGSGAMTISRQAFALGQTDVPDEPSYFCRHDQTTGATTTAANIRQRIAGVRTFAGKTVTLSFYAKASSAIALDVDLVQVFGTGGSPSGDVTANVFGPTLTTSWAKYTASVAVPSIGSKTLGTNGDDHLALLIQLPLSTVVTLDIAHVQLELGDEATPYDKRSFWDEYRDCLVYYWKTFPYATAPAQNAGLTGSITFGSKTSDANKAWRECMRHHPAGFMRASPTMTTYNPSAANAQARNVTDSADHSATVANGTPWGWGFDLTFSGSTAPSEYHAVHITADAEL